MENNEPAATAETSIPASPSWIGSDGKFVDYAAAPSGIKEVLEAKKFTGIEDVFKWGKEAEKAIGSGFRLPEKLDDSHLNTIFNKLGRPEKSDGYKLEIEGADQLPQDIIGRFKEFGHGLGLTQKQFNDVVKFELEAGNSIREAEKIASDAKLQQTYGKDIDKAIESAFEAANKLGISDLLIEKGLDRDADVVIKMNEIAKMLSEDGLKTGNTQTVSKEQTIAEIMADEAYLNRMHPRHQEVVNKLNKLYGIGG